MAPKSAVIRCDSSPTLGGGHVMRCSTLADALKGRGWNVSFICSEETLKTNDLLKHKGYEVSAPDKPVKSCDLIIIDHYDLGEKEEQGFVQSAKAVMVIDDLANRKHHADIIFDQTYGRTKEEFRPYVAANCKFLLGAEYALVRPQFAELRTGTLTKRKSLQSIERVLIFLTTIDAQGHTLKILQAVENAPRALTFDVVLSQQSKNFNAVQEHAVKSKHTIHIHKTADMAALMAAADVAIGSGGTTTWERCTLGLPSIIINLADNQDTVIAKLAATGAITHVGKMDDPALLGRLSAAFADILQWEPKNYIHKAEKAAAICDGQGAARTVAFLDEFCTGN